MQSMILVLKTISIVLFLTTGVLGSGVMQLKTEQSPHLFNAIATTICCFILASTLYILACLLSKTC